jgi:hypothetical protein
VSEARLKLSRSHILAFRRRVGALDSRLPAGAASLRTAAWAGLQDSMPRAALLSIQARVADADATSWEDPTLVQVWGPRFSTYVVPAQDHAVFTLARLPDDTRAREQAEDIAQRLDEFLGGRRMTDAQAAAGIGERDSNRLRYATATGRVLIRWEGARAPVVWTVPPPAAEPSELRVELLRRYLHVFGPSTATGFADWAGLKPAAAEAAFKALLPSLAAVQTPIGDGWILDADEALVRESEQQAAPARLLPSGDTYYLLQGRERELLVPDAAHRSVLWTSRVWPGALLVRGEVVGTWRRAQATMTIQPWRRLTRPERDAVEAEAGGLRLPGIDQPVAVRWGE